jgi:hypothetical protein
MGWREAVLHHFTDYGVMFAEVVSRTVNGTPAHGRIYDAV